MRRILIAATILAAGCGGKRTIPATPEIKAAAMQAQLGANASGSNTQTSLALQSLGASIGDAAARCCSLVPSGAGQADRRG